MQPVLILCALPSPTTMVTFLKSGRQNHGWWIQGYMDIRWSWTLLTLCIHQLFPIVHI